MTIVDPVACTEPFVAMKQVLRSDPDPEFEEQFCIPLGSHRVHVHVRASALGAVNYDAAARAPGVDIKGAGGIVSL